jgi:hypothetical protein
MARGSRKYNVIGKGSHWEAEVMKDGADLFRGDFKRFFPQGSRMDIPSQLYSTCIKKKKYVIL